VPPHKADSHSRHTPGNASQDSTATSRSTKRIPAMNIGTGSGFQGGVLGGVVGAGGGTRRRRDSESGNGECGPPFSLRLWALILGLDFSRTRSSCLFHARPLLSIGSARKLGRDNADEHGGGRGKAASDFAALD
jgi:hypothetical protein